MSWQDYVNKQLMGSKCVTKAAIVGHDGNVWAKSDGFEVSTDFWFSFFTPPLPSCCARMTRWRATIHRRNKNTFVVFALDATQIPHCTYIRSVF